MATKTRTQRARERATAQNKAKYGGQRSDLQSLLNTAATNYQSDLVAADAASRSAAHHARAAKPEVKRVYDAARAETQTASSDIDRSVAGLSSAADPYRAIIARERGLETGRVAAAGAQALANLTDREQGAVAGKFYAQQAAKTSYRNTVSDLQQKLKDLGDREGADVAATMGDILEKSAARRATSRNIRLTAGLTAAEHRRQEAAKVKEKAKGGGFKPGTHDDLRQFEGVLAQARQAINVLTTTGVPKKGDKAAKPKLHRITDRGALAAALVEKIPDQVALSAALDMAFDKHVSPETAKRMKAQRGVRVADMPGLTSYTDWYKRSRRPDTAGNPNVSS